jgi:hypothetical protein
VRTERDAALSRITQLEAQLTTERAARTRAAARIKVLEHATQHPRGEATPAATAIGKTAKPALAATATNQSSVHAGKAATAVGGSGAAVGGSGTVAGAAVAAALTVLDWTLDGPLDAAINRASSEGAADASVISDALSEAENDESNDENSTGGGEAFRAVRMCVYTYQLDLETHLFFFS